MDSRDNRIAERAHEIWEAEGRPEGRHEEHWRRACAEIDGAAPETGADAAGIAGGRHAGVTAGEAAGGGAALGGPPAPASARG